MKKLFLILGAAVIVVLGVVLGMMCIPAEIPSPTYYFANVGSITADHSEPLTTYRVQSEEDFREAVEEYVLILANWYPFAVSRFDMGDGTSFWYMFEYDGRKLMFGKRAFDVCIFYSDPADGETDVFEAELQYHDLKKYELTEYEQFSAELRELGD